MSKHLPVCQSQLLFLAGVRIQITLDRRDNFRGKSKQLGHFFQKIAKVGVRNRQKQVAICGLVGYRFLCRTCWHAQLLSLL
jgi:hypothetical protein